ncbi:MAG TPA: hypothetical protein VLX61_06290 [Anaerolineales bacterium]|nr:hypothetical protein [Anaerolineales bacterium]
MDQVMPYIVLLGFLLRAVGFLVAGFASGHFAFDNFKNSEWQVKIALALGFFGLLVGLTDFASAGSAGAFALGAGAAYFMSMMPAKPAGEKKS